MQKLCHDKKGTETKLDFYLCQKKKKPYTSLCLLLLL